MPKSKDRLDGPTTNGKEPTPAKLLKESPMESASFSLTTATESKDSGKMEKDTVDLLCSGRMAPGGNPSGKVANITENKSSFTKMEEESNMNLKRVISTGK